MKTFTLLIALLATSTLVQANEENENSAAEKILSGEVTLISDYVYRGMTQSWGKPALQASLDYAHSSGFYAGIWASQVSDKSFADGNAEVDISAGYSGVINDDWSYSLGALRVIYPGANYDQTLPADSMPNQRYDMTELSASLTYKWVTLEYSQAITDVLGFNANTGYTGSTKGSSYIDLGAAIPLPKEFELGLHIGFQNIKPDMAIPSIGGSTNPDYFDVSISLSKPLWKNVKGTVTLWHNFNDDLFVNLPSAKDPTDTHTLDDSWITFALSATF